MSSFVNTREAKNTFTCENTVPEVGLELHSIPCKHREAAKTWGIQASPKAFRPSTRRKVRTLSTPPSGALEDYWGTRCLEISAAESSKSIVPAATPTTRAEPSSVVEPCRSAPWSKRNSAHRNPFPMHRSTGGVRNRAATTPTTFPKNHLANAPDSMQLVA
jgi:hypothetical protein